MINVILGRKTDQTQKFLENGRRIPVTEIAVADNTVVQIKTLDKEAYSSVQLGIGVKKRPRQSLVGHAKKFGLSDTPIAIREVRIEANDAEEMLKSGDSVTVDAVLKPGDLVTITGTSKGKGFAGVVKRHGFHGGPKTHGQSDRHRAPGSIGQGTTPGRVYKGKRMAGRMGSDTVSVANLTVVDVDAENKKLYVSGLVPGVKKGLLIVTRVGEDKKYVQLLEVKQRSDAAAAIEAEKAAAQQAVADEQAAKEAAVAAEVEETKETSSAETKETEGETAVDEPTTDEPEAPVEEEKEPVVKEPEETEKPEEKVEVEK